MTNLWVKTIPSDPLPEEFKPLLLFLSLLMVCRVFYVRVVGTEPFQYDITKGLKSFSHGRPLLLQYSLPASTGFHLKMDRSLKPKLLSRSIDTAKRGLIEDSQTQICLQCFVPHRALDIPKNKNWTLDPCGADSQSLFYAVDTVPVHEVLLLANCGYLAPAVTIGIGLNNQKKARRGCKEASKR